MKVTTMTLVSAALVVGFAGAATLHAASTVLDFSSAGGSILDKDGQGTGFTTRLSGTGASLLANDANLDLDTAAGVLHMTSTDADINGVGMGPAGQRNLPMLEFIGLNLSSLGYSGGQDFSVRGDFSLIPPGMNSFDQFGVFVGRDSSFLTRGMSVNFSFFGGGNEGVADNINAGNSVDGNFFGQNPGATLTVQISRTAGVWTTIVNGINKTPVVQPTFLNAPASTDLTVGVWTYSTDATQFTVDLTRFEANVVPEPASLVLFGAALAAGVGWRRRR